MFKHQNLTKNYLRSVKKVKGSGILNIRNIFSRCDTFLKKVIFHFNVVNNYQNLKLMILQEIKPGHKIKSPSHQYEIKDVLSQQDGKFVFKAIDNNNKLKVLKSFENRVTYDNARCKYNHYGKNRDGSEKHFNEIKEKAEQYEFLINHYERFKYKNKYFIAIEYLDGTLLETYINDYLTEKINLCTTVVKLLAETLLEWHKNEFAHGDPHLRNAIVLEQNGLPIQVKLFDYSQIHHPEFKCCQKYNCFETTRKRKDQDLKNNDGKLGTGFLYGLQEIEEKKPDLKSLLSDTFVKSYGSPRLDMKT